ncbi:MAG: methylated-DNA--[protein]-cysteine S-methyltransferase [Candidatus Gastranaerophilales bacterium]|nr:methylated-DNA--[protein]-cysteine S-methyltransferase [Candidatus Gastranaerophilales bacterium]
MVVLPKIYQGYFCSPIGWLRVSCDDVRLLSVEFVEKDGESNPNEMVEEVIFQLQEYFDGKRKSFDIPCFHKGTDFQKKAWDALLKIPYGKTVSYQEQAQKIGNPKATRAIGSANNKNKIPIIYPCHRVIAKNGKLAGYAGGLDKKTWLLEHEMKIRQKMS